MSWTTLRVHPGADREAALAAMFGKGVQGIHEDGDLLVTHIDASVELAPVIAAICRASAGARVDTAPLDEMDWAEAWKESIHAHTLGPLTIAPPWLASKYDPVTTVVIEPAMAFGTGEHETTRGVIRLLPSIMRVGDFVVDLGAGSAVLSIAAAKLGASTVAAIELDHDAIENAECNVEWNHVDGCVTVIEGDAMQLLPLVAPAELVLANIISSVLQELLPIIALSLEVGGRAILSGILVAEREEMMGVLARDGWRVLAEDFEGAWWTVAIARV